MSDPLDLLLRAEAEREPVHVPDVSLLPGRLRRRRARRVGLAAAVVLAGSLAAVPVLSLGRTDSTSFGGAPRASASTLVPVDDGTVRICTRGEPSCDALAGSAARAFIRRLNTPDPADPVATCPAKVVQRSVTITIEAAGGARTVRIDVPLECGPALRTDTRTVTLFRAGVPAGLREELAAGLQPSPTTLAEALNFPATRSPFWSGPAGKVEPTVLSMRRGPEHCNDEDVVFLSGTAIAAPKGAPGYDDVTSRREGQYLRALPGTIEDKAVTDGLDLHATLPVDARFSGYRAAGVELWLGSDRSRFAYLVDAADPSHVERWVRPVRFRSCA